MPLATNRPARKRKVAATNIPSRLTPAEVALRAHRQAKPIVEETPHQSEPHATEALTDKSQPHAIESPTDKPVAPILREGVWSVAPDFGPIEAVPEHPDHGKDSVPLPTTSSLAAPQAASSVTVDHLQEATINETSSLPPQVELPATGLPDEFLQDEQDVAADIEVDFVDVSNSPIEPELEAQLLAEPTSPTLSGVPDLIEAVAAISIATPTAPSSSKLAERKKLSWEEYRQRKRDSPTITSDTPAEEPKQAKYRIPRIQAPLTEKPSVEKTPGQKQRPQSVVQPQIKRKRSEPTQRQSPRRRQSSTTGQRQSRRHSRTHSRTRDRTNQRPQRSRSRSRTHRQPRRSRSRTPARRHSAICRRAYSPPAAQQRTIQVQCEPSPRRSPSVERPYIGGRVHPRVSSVLHQHHFRASGEAVATTAVATQVSGAASQAASRELGGASTSIHVSGGVVHYNVYHAAAAPPPPSAKRKRPSKAARLWRKAQQQQSPKA